jgi:hypothetical protein
MTLDLIYYTKFRPFRQVKKCGNKMAGRVSNQVETGNPALPENKLQKSGAGGPTKSGFRKRRQKKTALMTAIKKR